MFRSFLVLAMTAVSFTLYGQSSEELAHTSAAVIGIGRDGLCSSCHAVNSIQTFQRWSQATKRVEICLTRQTASERLACIGQTADLAADFTLHAKQLGIFAAGIHMDPLNSLIKEALGESRGEALLKSLLTTTLMPLRSQEHMTKEEFAAVRAWFSADLPNLDSILKEGDGESVSCEESFDPLLVRHLKTMALTGWKARNESEDLPMFACPPGGGDCFGQTRNGVPLFPDISAGTASWKLDPDIQMRVLAPIEGRVQYWIRSSADGRFVGYGGSPSGIIDLQSLLGPNPEPRVISVNALYDPAFFPDDSGFMFQGSRTGICNMSILRDPTTTSITFREDACTQLNENRIPLYQSIGASLDGEDYLAATSHYQRDMGTISTVGEHIPSQDVAAESSNRLQLFPIQFDGDTWLRKPAQTFSTPFEVDWVLSHSNKLLVSRLQGEVDEVVRTVGYNLYMLSPDDDGSFRKTRVAQLCTDGLKGDFSYDDRFFATYAYIRPDHWRALGYKSANDPDFQKKLQTGTANIVLVDLFTKTRKFLTNAEAGQYAYFPHFRSDGWIYFENYESSSGRRQVIASDAAIRAAARAPLK